MKIKMTDDLIAGNLASFRASAIPRRHNGVGLGEDGVLFGSGRNRKHFGCGLRGEGAANRLSANPGIVRDLLNNAFRASDRARGLFPILCNNSPHFDQFGVAPEMFVPLVLRQIAAVKVFGQLPKLGLCV